MIARYCALLAMAVTALQAQAQHSEVEEIVVTAAFEGKEADTALPVGTLNARELREHVSNSIGDTLKSQLGVHSASFGSGVGQPIIRGQSGKRVQVLENGINVIDASAVSPDHANAVDAILARRIEVLRGPSTLLYGNGAIGGVVNVIDSRIPESLIERPDLVVQQTWNSVNGENRTIASFDVGAGNLAFHFDGYRRSNDNVDVKGFAIDEAALHALEELHGHDEEDEDHEEEALPNTLGYIGNSDSEGKGGSIGFSFVGDTGFIGFSASRLENEYGLPPGTHAHGHEEHGEEGDHEGEDEHGEDVLVRVDLEQTRYDIKGHLRFDDAPITSVRFSSSVTDYGHSEIEVDEGVPAIGTRYTNEGIEGRATVTFEPFGILNSVWGVQWSRSDFAAAGEESFIPKSDLSSIAIFGVERLDFTNATVELGARFGRTSVDPSSQCKTDETSVSLSASLLYDFSIASNLLIAVSRSQRAPTVEELLSNIEADTCARPVDNEDLVVHAATGLFEVGNANLGNETSTNLEIGIRKHAGELTAELNVFLNNIDDYIFLDVVDEFEGTDVAVYTARDARFVGLEGALEYPLIESGIGMLVVRFSGDLVRADFDTGGNVPRIPPARFGVGFRYFGDDWTVNLTGTRVADQGRTAVDELPTDGYNLLALYADYHFDFGKDRELLLFLRGNNLLDREIRNHASFLKNFAPEPGRSFQLGVRLGF